MHLDLLNSIKKIEAPPFLKTRVNARIKEQQSKLIKPASMLAFTLGFFLLVFVNIGVLKSYNKSQASEQLEDSFELYVNHNLY